MCSLSINRVKCPTGDRVNSVHPSHFFCAAKLRYRSTYKIFLLAYVLSACFPHLSLLYVSLSLSFVFYIFYGIIAGRNFKDFRYFVTLNFTFTASGLISSCLRLPKVDPPAL